MQIQQLQYFLEIASEKSISRAAKNLYLSQPTLSQQVIKLEEELGIPLLVRHSKSVSLTDAGEQFEQHSRRILGSLNQLQDLMKHHSIMQAGTLQIGLLWIAGYIDMLPILNSYRQIYPKVQLQFQIDGSSALLQQLLNRSLHAAFMISEEHQLAGRKKELYYQKIQEDYYVALVSPQNPLAERDVLSIEDLRHQPIIMPSRASALYRQISTLFERRYIVPNVLCETSMTDLVAQLVSHNFGVGFCSHSIAQRIQTPELRLLPMSEVLHRPVYYVTLQELLSYPTVKTFTEHVLTSFSSHTASAPPLALE